jgi:hypothetical protein
MLPFDPPTAHWHLPIRISRPSSRFFAFFLFALGVPNNHPNERRKACHGRKRGYREIYPLCHWLFVPCSVRFPERLLQTDFPLNSGDVVPRALIRSEAVGGSGLDHSRVSPFHSSATSYQKLLTHSYYSSTNFGTYNLVTGMLAMGEDT